jgi:Zn-dependent oligopeptidase
MFQTQINGPNSPNTPSTTETPSPSTKLTAEAVIEQLRTMQSQIDGLSALSRAQRTVSSRRAARQSAPVIAASMDVISSSDAIAVAVGQPVDEVLQLQQDNAQWSIVAGELRGFLSKVEGANLLRREKLALIASQAYSVGTQLVRNPANSDLVPHVEQIKRLKSVTRRKKASPAPQPSPSPSPSVPAPATAPSHDTTTKQQA